MVFCKKTCSMKKGRPVFGSLFNEVASPRLVNLLIRKSNAVVFHEFCKIFRNIYLKEHLRTAAFIVLNIQTSR